MKVENLPVRPTRLASRITALLGTLILLDASATGAQVPTVAPGTRVRMEFARPSPKVVGVVMSQTADSIAIGTGRAIQTVASASIERFRVSGGKSHTHGAVRGMKMGTLIGGGAVFLVFGAYYLASSEPNKNPGGLAVYTAAGALEGALLGAAIGGALGAERWSTIYHRPVRIAVLPLPNGAAGAGLSISF